MVSFRNSTCIGEIGCGWKSRERQSPSGGGHTVNAWKRECNVLCAAGENRHSLLSLCPSFLLKHTPPLQLQLHPYWSQPPLLRTVEREKVRTLCRGKSLWSLHSRVCFSWASWVRKAWNDLTLHFLISKMGICFLPIKVSLPHPISLFELSPILWTYHKIYCNLSV